MRAGEEAVLAGDAVAFHDLGDVADDAGHPLQLSRHGPYAQPCGDRQAEGGRRDDRAIAGYHACFLQPAHPLGHARRRQPDGAGQLGHRHARIVGERGEDGAVDGVQPFPFASNTFRQIFLASEGGTAAIASGIPFISGMEASMMPPVKENAAWRSRAEPGSTGWPDACRRTRGSASAPSSTISARPLPCCCFRRSACSASPGSASPRRRWPSRPSGHPGAPSATPTGARGCFSPASACASRR